MSTKPEIQFPDGPAPAQLVIEDLTVGDGPEAVPGGTVEVHYVGVDYDSGEEFDSSWGRGQSISFPLQGLDSGLAGRHPGNEGRRPSSVDHSAGAGLRTGRLGASAVRQDADLRDRSARRPLGRRSARRRQLQQQTCSAERAFLQRRHAAVQVRLLGYQRQTEAGARVRRGGAAREPLEHHLAFRLG